MTTMVAVPNDVMLTTRDVCLVLRCHRNTVVNYVRRGLLAPVRITTRKNLFRESDVAALIDRVADDDAATIRAAMALLAEAHAEDQRPLCPSCAKRRVNRSASLCTWCEQNAETQLLHKRNWWDKTGSKQRVERREAAAGV